MVFAAIAAASEKEPGIQNAQSANNASCRYGSTHKEVWSVSAICTAMNPVEKDVFREVPLRYCGYANEVGEAFRHVVPLKFVYFSYFVSSTYVVSHSFFQGLQAKKRLSKSALTNHKWPAHSYRNKPLSPTKAVVDTLMWQGLASVIIPGLLINRTCALSRLLLYHCVGKRLSRSIRHWIVTGVGLTTIPFIIHPIDR